MSDSIQIPSALIISDDVELVSSLIESNNTEQQFHSRETMQIALEDPSLLTDNSIVILDVDSEGNNIESAVDQALNLKKADPTQVLIMVGQPEAMSEILKSNIQPLIYRAFNKPIHPNQVLLAFRSANELHSDLTARQADGENISVIGPAENRITTSSLAEQRSNKSALYAVIGLACLGLIGWFLFSGKSNDDQLSKQKSITTSEQPLSEADEFTASADVSISEVNRLNQLAATALLEARLSQPANDNALYYYNKVLAIDPYDVTAYKGKQHIATMMRERYQPYIDNAEFDNALNVVNTLQSIEPLNRRNDKLRKNLEIAISKYVKKIQEGGSKEEIDRTTAVLEKIGSELEGSKTAAAALQNEKRLITKIDFALGSGNLIPPLKGNAYSLVSAALKNNTISKANFTPRIKALSEKLVYVANKIIKSDDIQLNDVEEAQKLAALIKRLDVGRKSLALLNKDIQAQKAEFAKLEEKPEKPVIVKKETKPEPPKIIPAIIISQAPPRYPNRALDREIEGWVEVTFTINAIGEPVNIGIIDSKPKGVFDNSALRGVKKWRFTPAKNEQTGLPVESTIDAVKVHFKLS